ncbi:hypothetical protein BHYA_0066g00160 [Botrytis hyacinthi]|uniref:Uncharacterized protein n=1 Tax=Botrytis hyacinthi TaxID=278943 RepID=A0A4Z1GR71_9HELO|nr:hypothetical protein BHYA_0066g00160 [Botrytis hyacinthi]
MRATLSSILLAQRSTLERIETIKATNCDPDADYLPLQEDSKFRAELNEGVGFYLDIYSSSEEVISLLHKWPFDDAMKGITPSEHLPYLDLIMQFDQLHGKLRKLGQASLGYRVKYHYIPASENRAVEMEAMAELDRYAAKLEKNWKEIARGEETETEEQVEEPPILKTTPISKSGGTSIQTPKSAKKKRNLKEKEKVIAIGDETETDEEMQELLMPKTTPVSKSGGKSFLTPQSTPIQKPKPKLKLISRDPRVRGNSAPKPPES